MKSTLHIADFHPLSSFKDRERPRISTRSLKSSMPTVVSSMPICYLTIYINNLSSLSGLLYYLKFITTDQKMSIMVTCCLILEVYRFFSTKSCTPFTRPLLPFCFLPSSFRSKQNMLCIQIQILPQTLLARARVSFCKNTA